MSTLTSKGQMTLPKAAREALHLKPGQRLRVEVTADGGWLLRPIRLNRGLFPRRCVQWRVLR